MKIKHPKVNEADAVVSGSDQNRTSVITRPRFVPRTLGAYVITGMHKASWFRRWISTKFMRGNLRHVSWHHLEPRGRWTRGEDSLNFRSCRFRSHVAGNLQKAGRTLINFKRPMLSDLYFNCCLSKLFEFFDLFQVCNTANQCIVCLFFHLVCPATSLFRFTVKDSM